MRNGQAAVQALAEGETVTETFNVQVTDDDGRRVTTQPVTVDVTGTNDAPVITGRADIGRDRSRIDTNHRASRPDTATDARSTTRRQT